MKYVGKDYGSWKILADSYTDKYGSKFVNCKCKMCGEVKCTLRAKVIDGTFECGCENIESNSNLKKHIYVRGKGRD